MLRAGAIILTDWDFDSFPRSRLLFKCSSFSFFRTVAEKSTNVILKDIFAS